MKKYLLLSFVLLSICITAQGFRAGQKFADNSKMYSPSGNFYVVFQNDGNLVMINNRTGVPIWSSKTTHSGDRAEFQRDGNLVVYNQSGTPVFSSNTGNRGSVLKIQDDGNLVIYNRNNDPVWSSMENKGQDNNDSNSNNFVLRKGHEFRVNSKIYSQNRQFYLVFQSDGNLVVYDVNGIIIWDTKTANRGVKATFQYDGNLVVTDRRGEAIYGSKTNNRNATTLRMQNDGNLVISGPGDAPIWGSDSDRQ